LCPERPAESRQGVVETLQGAVVGPLEGEAGARFAARRPPLADVTEITMQEPRERGEGRVTVLRVKRKRDQPFAPDVLLIGDVAGKVTSRVHGVALGEYRGESQAEIEKCGCPR